MLIYVLILMWLIWMFTFSLLLITPDFYTYYQKFYQNNTINVVNYVFEKQYINSDNNWVNVNFNWWTINFEDTDQFKEWFYRFWVILWENKDTIDIDYIWWLWSNLQDIYNKSWWTNVNLWWIPLF